MERLILSDVEVWRTAEMSGRSVLGLTARFSRKAMKLVHQDLEEMNLPAVHCRLHRT